MLDGSGQASVPAHLAAYQAMLEAETLGAAVACGVRLFDVAQQYAVALDEAGAELAGLQVEVQTLRGELAGLQEPGLTPGQEQLLEDGGQHLAAAAAAANRQNGAQS